MGFKKGQSGNPGGRPKDEARIRELARKHCPEAIRTLAKWMRSKNPKASVSASQALLDRGFGKPGQAIELSGPGGGPLETVGIVTNDPAEAARAYQDIIKGA